MNRSLPLMCWLVLASVASMTAAASDARLLDAVKAGNHEVVRAILKEPGTANAREADGTTALHWAVRADDLADVQLLLGAGANPEAANRYGITPLSLAATNGHAAILEALLRAGADANGAPRDGQTVLMTASRTGKAEAIAALLAHGADPNVQEAWLGETALMWAAVQDHAAAVRVLVAHGARTDARSALSTIPTLTASGIGLITMEFPKGGWTALMYAAREGAVAATRALAEGGADLNAAGPDGMTPLLLAIINAHYDEAAVLIEKGADPNRADQSGMTALYAVVDMHTLPWMQGRPDPRPAGAIDEVEIAKRLLAAGANPNATLTTPLIQRNHTAGDPGLGAMATPLMRAAKGGDATLMRLLVDHGADPMRLLKNHTTPLMLAAGTSWRDGGGAFPTRDRGTEQGAIDAITLCLSWGGDINAVNDAGDTALHGAAGRGADLVVQYLVDHGARLDAKNKQGRTPLAVATTHRERPDTIALLRQLMGASAPSAPAAP